jgi:hypothetical protein
MLRPYRIAATTVSRRDGMAMECSYRVFRGSGSVAFASFRGLRGLHW